MSLIHVFGLEQEYMFLVWVRKTRACDIGKEAEAGGLVQPGEEMALEGANCVLQPPTLWVELGISLLVEVHTERTGENKHKVQQEKLWLNTWRKKFHSKIGQAL